jgi:hypothetical protein
MALAAQFYVQLAVGDCARQAPSQQQQQPPNFQPAADCFLAAAPMLSDGSRTRPSRTNEYTGVHKAFTNSTVHLDPTV